MSRVVGGKKTREVGGGEGGWLQPRSRNEVGWVLGMVRIESIQLYYISAFCHNNGSKFAGANDQQRLKGSFVRIFVNVN